MPTKIEQQKKCQCGCGKLAPLASKTNKKRGWIKGQPIRYIWGHASRKQQTAIAFNIDKITGCWIWQGSKISTGYGNLRVNGEYYLAHRYMYELINSKIPENLELDHLCRNPLCINPKHLEAVTHAENCRRGSCAKLSDKTAKEIKALRRSGQSTAFIAAYYGVGRTTITSVLNGKAWA